MKSENSKFFITEIKNSQKFNQSKKFVDLLNLIDLK